MMVIGHSLCWFTDAPTLFCSVSITVFDGVFWEDTLLLFYKSCYYENYWGLRMVKLYIKEKWNIEKILGHSIKLTFFN